MRERSWRVWAKVSLAALVTACFVGCSAIPVEETKKDANADVLATQASQISASCNAASPYVTNPPAFSLATAGCPMAHCAPTMSDRVSLASPRGGVQTLWQDQSPVGSSFGLGCSSSGSLIVCSYYNGNGFQDNIVAYNINGKRLWTSRDCMGRIALGSAPIIGADNSVIVASMGVLMRFDSKGNVIWRQALPSGLPISPVITKSGVILIAVAAQEGSTDPNAGALSAYDSKTGAPLGTLCVKRPQDSSCYDTVNTPGVDGNRAYISMVRPDDPNNTGWLVAVDVNKNAAQPLKKAWHYTFGGPSGASPMVHNGVVYFDGVNPSPSTGENPHLFAVKESSAGTPQLLWRQPIGGNVQASLALDPRGGFWTFGVGVGTLERRSLSTGKIIKSFNVASLLGVIGSYMPSSALTIAGPDSQPVLLAGAISTEHVLARRSWVMALDLNTEKLLWKVRVDSISHPLDFTSGQFVVTNPANPIVVFSSHLQGARAVSLR